MTNSLHFSEWRNSIRAQLKVDLCAPGAPKARKSGCLCVNMRFCVLMPWGALLGNTLIMGCPRCRSVNSATGKMKVGGKLPLCSISKFVLPVEYEKHLPRPAKVHP